MKHILLALLLTLPLAAQTPADHTAQADRELKQEEQQKMLGVVPAYSAVLNGQAVSLNPRQKFQLFFADAIDPFDFIATAADAGLEQYQNEFPEYGQGFKGYAKRYGAGYADDFDGGLWASAILPSVLHQDPRYFRLGHGSFVHRVGYTAAFLVRCRGDNGRWQPNYSNIGGNLIGGAISNAYYPSADRGVGLTFERGFTVAAEDSIGNFAVEFYPDFISFLKRRVHHHPKP
ncbi:MAG: hypothetical protein V4555_10475 [Acidobacteriota bacterium]